MVSGEGCAVALNGADGDSAAKESVELGVGGVGMVVQGVGDEPTRIGSPSGRGRRDGRVILDVLLFGVAYCDEDGNGCWVACRCVVVRHSGFGGQVTVGGGGVDDKGAPPGQVVVLGGGGCCGHVS